MSDLVCEILVIDKNEERINSILPFVTDARIGDCTNADFMRTLDVSEFSVCIVTIGDDFQSSLETTSILKDLGARVVVSRAVNDIQVKFLLRNGADRVVNPEKQVAKWTAVRYTSDHILDYIPLDDDHAIYEVDIPSDWVGKTVGGVDIRKRYNINIMGIKHEGKTNLTVTPDTVLAQGSTMLVLGEYKDLHKCFRI